MFGCSVDGYPIHDQAKIQLSLAVKLRLAHFSVITWTLGISLWLGSYLSVVQQQKSDSSISLSLPFHFLFALPSHCVLFSFRFILASFAFCIDPWSSYPLLWSSTRPLCLFFTSNPAYKELSSHSREPVPVQFTLSTHIQFHERFTHDDFPHCSHILFNPTSNDRWELSPSFVHTTYDNLSFHSLDSKI